ncbi:MAG: ADP-ribosylglycohydrolase family protein [Candidatus Eisenbacteria bacterium]|nr:ADP-ribosylglycohydrolase family protein [Candidatus Eisenbacteria bacterium]
MNLTPLERLRLSLTGLSTGDAFGETFLRSPTQLEPLIATRELPPGPWTYTDDSEMAFSIVELLARDGTIDQDRLALAFAHRFDRARGYGSGASRLLAAVRDGADWRVEAPRLFPSGGSYGNGAAMRVAPLGAFFAEDEAELWKQATASAQVTHAHTEAVAGAIAVALAAAWASRFQLHGDAAQPAISDNRRRFLVWIRDRLPETEVRRRVGLATQIPFEHSPEDAARALGSGYQTSAQDTVPFVLWCAARHLEDYAAALWTTVRGQGDIDTNCAMVGGIVALSAGAESVPPDWLTRREGLPREITELVGAA